MDCLLLLGSLVHDPESRISSDGKKAVFTIAVNSKYKVNNECKINFFDCEAYGELAEEVISKCKKGNYISVSGYLDSNIIEHGNKKQYVISIIAQRVSIVK